MIPFPSERYLMPHAIDKGFVPHARNGDNTRRTQNPWTNRYSTRNEEQREPAWMDDNQPMVAASVDLASAGSQKFDPLVQFVPGEDKIAAHKRTMRERGAEEDWRGEKPLVSFFSADAQGPPMPTSAELPTGPPLPTPKQKIFNAADYIKPSKQLNEIEQGLVDADMAANVNKSRFQRFFGGGSSVPPTLPVPPTPDRWNATAETPLDIASPPIHAVQLLSDNLTSPVHSYAENLGSDGVLKSEDHMAKLMGMLGHNVCFCIRNFRTSWLILAFRARIPPLVFILPQVTEHRNPDKYRTKHHRTWIFVAFIDQTSHHDPMLHFHLLVPLLRTIRSVHSPHLLVIRRS